MPMTANAGTTARARVRAELTEEIKAAARRQLQEVGASELSLRAVARELGMVSSALYRYFASRDELLTALVIDAYDAVGAVAEEAAADARGGVEARWLRVGRAIRDWAVEHPHDYALVYGTPIPGYRAPTDTVDPAARVAVAALAIVADGVASGEIDATRTVPISRTYHGELALLRDGLGLAIPDEVLARALHAWTELFGLISFELFGHFANVIEDHEGHADHQLRRSARILVGGS